MARTTNLDPEDLDGNVADLMPAFVRLSQAIPDPRREHLRVHRLDAILFIVLAANMAGITSMLGAADFAVDYFEWCRRYVVLHTTPPNHQTIGRLLAALDPERLEELLRLVAAG